MATTANDTINQWLSELNDALSKKIQRQQLIYLHQKVTGAISLPSPGI